VNAAGSGAGASFDRRAIPAGAVESRWSAADGWPIRRFDWPAPAPAPADAGRGSLLFMPGRADEYEKYLEAFAHWRGRGWSVTSADWRGQAGSGRCGKDAITGDIGDYAVWVNDLAGLWAEWQQASPGPHVLIAHSMGGHIALRALAERRIDPAAVVLSTPMLGFSRPRAPLPLLQAIAWVMTKLGDPRRPAWKWRGQPGSPPPGRMELLTHDEQRYNDELWWRRSRPELALGPPSWRWIARGLASYRLLRKRGALEGIDTPVLILAASADRLVDFGAIARAARRLPHARLVTFGREARHEILRECDAVRDRALAAIDEFLARAAARGE
jgi:lysophospholipase